MDCSHIRFCVRDTALSQDGQVPSDVEQIKALFDLTAFWAKDRSLEDWAIALSNSNPVITVWDGERLIGFARATSDGIFRATIWDVAIHPEYQGVGLGSKLVETLLSHPRMNRVERIYLMTTYQQQFYKRIGFEENTSTTMVLHNRPLMPELLERERSMAASIESE
ncbi:MAG: GNAT family N-acetyltransferase [Cyanobacteriota bacterium]|nr:GNAT family N-acetyltransferase [Cyanobacteriota bacterium]